MPRKDGTGPIGRGTMTGRGLGFCTGVNADRYGAGLGRGIGLGYGCRRGSEGRYNGQLSGLTDKQLLTEQKELLQKRLDAISKQLENY